MISKTIYFVYGRMNPMTVGHERNINFARRNSIQFSATFEIVLSATEGNNRNPLTLQYRKELLGIMAPGVTITSAVNLIEKVKEYAKDYNHLVLVVGRDRVARFDYLLNKYNDVEYKFDSIKVRSSGERNLMISGSRMREFVLDNNLPEFRMYLPILLQDRAEEIFNKLREGMKCRSQNQSKLEIPSSIP